MLDDAFAMKHKTHRQRIVQLENDTKDEETNARINKFASLDINIVDTLMAVKMHVLKDAKSSTASSLSC